jgi:hypothetical protein
MRSNSSAEIFSASGIVFVLLAGLDEKSNESRNSGGSMTYRE